jgi:N-acetylmuramoyl-L-alanine amidase
MNKALKKSLSLIMAVSLSLSYSALTTVVKASQDSTEKSLTLQNEKDESINEQVEVSQIDPKFPEDDPTSRIYARFRRTFKAYKGKGSIIVENNNAKNADVYINGEKISIKKALKEANSKVVMDIGKYTVDGVNTIKVLNVQPEESYINIYIPYPTLEKGKPEDIGFSKEKLEEVDKLIDKEVEKGFPGAALLIIKDGKIVKNTAYGYKRKYNENNLMDKFETMTVDTMFDLASNTKMFATNLALHKLVSEGKIDTNELVCTYIPGFTSEGRENVTVKHLLTHSSGLDSSIHFYKPETKIGPEFYSLEREKTLKLLEKAPLVYETGTKTKYSDTGFMLLGYIIEEVTGQRLDEYVENNIYKPLGLKHTMFTPTDKGISKAECAATERNGNTRDFSRDFPEVRKYTLQGEVHDEKAYYSMAGVSGHAGLFSTTSDLAILSQTLLNGGGYGNYKLCDEAVIEQFAKPSDISINYGLGWNRAADGGRAWQFSPYASNLAIGHTGWTGTLTVIDPKYDMTIILLTNKKHSPCPEGKFEGDKFETGKYGSIVSLIYEALLENRNEEINTKLPADKVEKPAA